LRAALTASSTLSVSPDLEVLVLSSNKTKGLAQGVLLEVTQRSLNEGFSPSAPSLASYWEEKGFVYSEEEKANIKQVVVRLNLNDNETPVLSYPADKVWRKAAFNIFPSKSLLHSLEPHRVFIPFCSCTRVHPCHPIFFAVTCTFSEAV
jgi:hypothetical protein